MLFRSKQKNQKDKPQKQKEIKRGLSLGEISFGKPKIAEYAIFIKQLSVALESGLSLVESLLLAKDSTKGRLKRTISEIAKEISEGVFFADALEKRPKLFSNLIINSVRAGEMSGNLVANLQNISIELEKEKELSQKIRSAMIYPIIVLVASFVLGLTLTFMVLPKITPIFEGLRVDLPLTTRMLISFSNFIKDHGLISFLTIFTLIILIFWIIKLKASRRYAHYLILKTPIIGKVVKNSNLARFARTLGMLLKSGIGISEALEITKNTVGNYHYKKSLEEVRSKVLTGNKLSESLGEFDNLFPILALKMIKVGEESGKFEESLFYLAKYFEGEVDNSTKTLSTAIEPILLLAIGSIVGFLAISIITPIYDITGNIRK